MDDSLQRLIAFAAAVVPAIIFLTYFLAATRVTIGAEMLWAGFGFGACAAFPAVVLAVVLDSSLGFGTGELLHSIRAAFLGAAVPEETLKFTALLILCGRHLSFLRSNHIFMLAVATALGFAAFENLLYVLEGGSWGPIAVLRSITAVPGHAFAGAVMGYCIVRATIETRALIWWVGALVMPITLHGLYNLFAIAGSIVLEAPVGDVTLLSQVFAVCFFLTVIAEGALAHFCLRDVNMLMANERLVYQLPPGEQDSESRPPSYTQPALWFSLGILCHLGAVAILATSFLSGTDGQVFGRQAERMSSYGLAILFVLHGLAFVYLAVVLRRRSYLH